MAEEHRIINTYDQCCAAGGDRIVLSYYAKQPRSVLSSRWKVHRYVNGVSVKTDSTCPWYDYGDKSFSGFSGRKKSYAEAVTWVTENFGPREFVRNRMGDFVEKEVNEKFPIPKIDK